MTLRGFHFFYRSKQLLTSTQSYQVNRYFPTTFHQYKSIKFLFFLIISHRHLNVDVFKSKIDHLVLVLFKYSIPCMLSVHLNSQVSANLSLFFLHKELTHIIRAQTSLLSEQPNQWNVGQSNRSRSILLINILSMKLSAHIDGYAYISRSG